MRELSAADSTAKNVFAKMVATGRAARAIVEADGIGEAIAEADLAQLVAAVVREHPSVAGRIRAGEGRLSEFLMGRIMAASGGRADPRRARELLAAALRAEESS
jgi:Asp-tRNA(Asn)/Glu-tRNA(Gln) amidotransferase B subunit